MSSIVKLAGVFLLVIVIAAGVVAVDFLRHNGQFRTLTPHFAGHCQTLDMGASAADLRLDRAHRLAYLSYLDRRATSDGRSGFGSVMLVDLDAPAPRPRAAVANDPPGFRPAGLSLFTAAGGPQRLFVISRRPLEASGTEHSVEILEQGSAGGFRPLRTIHDPLLVSPHSILAVGADEFYVANDSGADGALGRAIETLFSRRLASVTYFDGKSMRVVLDGIAAATGLAASPDGSRVYLGEGLLNRVNVYARDPSSGALTLERRVELPGAPAGIDVDAGGELWVAVNPQPVALIRHLSDPRKLAPTELSLIHI